MMVGRDLQKKLNYTGMEKGIRKLALKDKLATAEEIATMSELEVCDLICKNYQLVYAESEKIGLVKYEDEERLLEMIKVISR